MKFKTILVAGSIAFDYIFQYGDEFKQHFEGHDLSKISTCFFTPERKRFFGGTGGNIAYTYSLFGDTPRLVSVCGGDFHGDYENWLRDHGVDLEMVKIIENGDTACAYITTDTRGNQITNFYPGSSIAKQDLGVDFSTYEDPLMIISPMNLENMIELADQANEADVPYIFDPGQQITLFDGETMKRMCENAFLVIVNEYELGLLKKHVDPSTIERLIFTKGEDGSEFISAEEQFNVEVVRPESIVDPTGCGDAYRGGLLHGLHEGLGWKRACELGAMAAAKSIEQEGTQMHIV